MKNPKEILDQLIHKFIEEEVSMPESVQGKRVVSMIELRDFIDPCELLDLLKDYFFCKESGLLIYSKNVK